MIAKKRGNKDIMYHPLVPIVRIHLVFCPARGLEAIAVQVAEEGSRSIFSKNRLILLTYFSCVRPERCNGWCWLDCVGNGWIMLDDFLVR